MRVDSFLCLDLRLKLANFSFPRKLEIPIAAIELCHPQCWGQGGGGWRKEGQRQKSLGGDISDREREIDLDLHTDNCAWCFPIVFFVWCVILAIIFRALPPPSSPHRMCGVLVYCSLSGHNKESLDITKGRGGD